MNMHIRTVYFSATGTTKTIVSRIADGVGERLGGATSVLDVTLPQARVAPLRFAEGDLVIFGLPVYAGRIPNVLLPYLETMEGGGALAVPVVLYGNRNYDDALIELRDLLARRGLRPIAAAAFIGEHAFSSILAAGRPDEADLTLAGGFAANVAEKARQLRDSASIPELFVKGTPYPHAGYYMPRDRQGNPIDIRKVKPLTDASCTDCKRCAALCPMGSIDSRDVRAYTNICIKCGACIKGCPARARRYEDPGYLHHQRELEETYTRRAEPDIFL
jgi:ferredoxin/flavodoxin